MTIVVQTSPVVPSQNITVQERSGPAFQPFAFQQPGFQTSYSQQAFQKCAFSYEGFQTDECISNGRSGYWRLFFMQMQEEALKKEIERVAEEVIGTVYEVKTAKKTVKKKAVPSQVVKEEPIPPIPFVRKPVKAVQTAVEKLNELPQMYFGVSVERLTAQIIQFDVEKEKRRRHRRKVAAFLLMAA